MLDSEKIELINQMIADFWEFNDEEQREMGAISFVNTIYTVINFNGKEETNAEN